MTLVPTERAARYRLGNMLQELWDAAGLRPRQVEALGIPASTLRDWRTRRAAPSAASTDRFWHVVIELQQAAGFTVYSDTEWETALRAAQEEGAREQYRQIDEFRRRKGRSRFVQLHEPGRAAARDDVRKRRRERKIMDDFVNRSSPEALSYLGWQADAPVGKTVLLADYVRKPPSGTDILNFFVSAEHRTNTRAVFAAEMADQIEAFLQASPPPAAGVRQWRERFALAAARSQERGRRLLLVIDGLDDDVAWSDSVAGGRAPAGADHGSIAALLPLAPSSGMRVIFSLRRGVRFPDDVPNGHPLRCRDVLRPLAAIQGITRARTASVDSTPLGRTVAGLFATAGGGLRTVDLAELTGASLEALDRLVQGPEGRSFVLEDPVFKTYALHPDLVQVVREDVGEAEVARHTRALCAWSNRWRAAGWPETTPPYPLARQARLLTSRAERDAYIFDVPRLRRLAATAGPEAALAQLDEFEQGVSTSESVIAALGLHVPLAAARTLLRGETREVPPGAPALLFRLGHEARARGLARSAASAAARAVHLADVAVEAACAGQDNASALALEAVRWLSRTEEGFPGTLHAPEMYARLLGAARTLVSSESLGAARSLLRAVACDRRAGVESLTEAAGMLAVIEDADVVASLREQADNLSEGSTRARVAAVDLWGELARAVPSRGPCFGDRIEDLCAALDPSDGLGIVDVLSVAATALMRLPAKRHKAARRLAWQARDVIMEAVADPTELPEEDQAHLGRELAGTLARFVQAMDAIAPTKDHFADAERLLSSLPEHLHTGVFRDDILEQARSLVEDAKHRRQQEEEIDQKAKQEARRARRRGQDEQSIKGKRCVASHRASAGLHFPEDGRLLTHERLMHEADEQLHANNPARSLELLEAALRNSPASLFGQRLSAGWTLDLAQSLGSVGEFEESEALVAHWPSAEDRVRHLAALSLGCSLGGHLDAAERYAQEAARLVPTSAGSHVRNVVAQALAHAGGATEALAHVTGRAAERRQALTAVAVGLAFRCPDEAARIVESLVQDLTVRIDEGSPIRALLELAALLLAFPDIREPDFRLQKSLRTASLRVAHPSQQWHAPSMAVLTLLMRLGCFPDEVTLTDATDMWQRSLQAGQEPCAELALLSVMDGDTTALWRHAEAARSPNERAEALSAAAAFLVGVPVSLTTYNRADDRRIRTCLALIRASRVGNPPDPASATDIVDELLRTDEWTRTVPLLPQLAPDALARLSLIARSIGPESGGNEALEPLN